MSPPQHLPGRPPAQQGRVYYGRRQRHQSPDRTDLRACRRGSDYRWPQRGHYAQAHVCAAKAGIDMLIRTLAAEWADDGVRCVGIAPGPVADTQGMVRLAPQGQESWTRLLRSIPCGRAAFRQEVADLALYLASDSGRYINGVVIPIDGGFCAVSSLEFGRMLKDSVAQGAAA